MVPRSLDLWESLVCEGTSWSARDDHGSGLASTMVPSGHVQEDKRALVKRKASVQVQALPLTGTIAWSVPPGSDSLTVQ